MSDIENPSIDTKVSDALLIVKDAIYEDTKLLRWVASSPNIDLAIDGFGKFCKSPNVRGIHSLQDAIKEYFEVRKEVEHQLSIVKVEETTDRPISKERMNEILKMLNINAVTG